jgi:flagellar hook-associated protein 1 FlgK
MPTFSSLNTAYSGLSAQRRVLDITAHNVANAATPGYHRQRADLISLGKQPVSGVFSGTSQTYGVDIAGISRSYDGMLAARAMREGATKSATDLTNTTMSTIEGIFPEPTDLGLAHQLDVFWASWTDVANDPGSAAARTQLLENAATLTDSLHRTSADLQNVADAAVARMNVVAAEVNGLSSQIAELNRAINATPEGNLDMLDQRDQLMARMSQLTGATSTEHANGEIDVYIAGRNIVSGTITQQVDGTTGTLTWVNGGQPVNPTSGEAAAITATLTDIVPRYKTLLDGVASSLVTTVNTVHSAGYDQSSTTGRNFFDPANLTADTISLSIDVAGLPANVAAGAPVMPGPTAPGVLDGEQARLLARLADSATGADTKYQQLITGLAVETKAAKNRAEIQDQVAVNASRDADSVGAVSIDEEMTNLIAAQRGFEANARILTAVDEMIGYLIERTGLAGR